MILSSIKSMNFSNVNKYSVNVLAKTSLSLIILRPSEIVMWTSLATILASYNVQAIQQAGKFGLLPRQGTCRHTDIIDIRVHRIATSVSTNQLYSDDCKFLFILLLLSK